MNTISRTELKFQLGLGKVSDITSVRKGLGQRDWQNSQLSEIDTAEVREYYRLVREEMMAPADALIQIASQRNGYAEQCDQIDDMAIDHSQHRDGDEEVGGMLSAVRDFTQEASLGMTDISKVAASHIVDALLIGTAANVISEISDRTSQARSGFNSVANQLKTMPLDLRSGSLPGKKTETKQLKPGLWG